MSATRLIVSFDHLSEADLQAKAGFILASLNGNPDFPAPWPAPVPSLGAINATFDNYRAAYHASQSRDRNRIAERNEVRQSLVRMLHQLAAYLELVAEGDAQKLGTTGFDLRRDSGRPVGGGGSPASLEVPQEFRAGLGPRGGTVHVEAARLAGAAAYEIQTNRGDPGAEADWHQALIVASPRQVLLEGQPTGPVWTRLRGIGTQGNTGPWSAPISVMVG